MKFLIDFTESSNKSKALENLKKYGQKITETEISLNTLFVIDTDLEKNKVSEILFIPKGKIIDSKKSNKGLAVIEVHKENYITDTEDSSESLREFIEQLSVSGKKNKESEQTRETAVTNSGNSEAEKPGIKALAVPVGKSPKGSFGFGTKFLDRFPLKSKSPSKEKSKMEDSQPIYSEEGYDDVDIDNPEENFEQPKPKVFNTDICKLDSRSTVPVWSNSINPEDRISLVEAYIRDLNRAKDLHLFQNDEILIFTSLVNSNKTKLYDELPIECTKSVEEFVKYLQSAYGRTNLEKRQSLNNLKQGTEESVFAFISRVVNLYYGAKDMAPKSLEEVQNDDVAKNDIIYYFINGLRNDEVKLQLKMRLLSIPFLDLPKVAKSIYDAIEHNTKAPVNLIPKPAINTLKPYEALESKLDTLEKQFAEVLAINDDGSFNRGRPRNNFYRRRSRSNDYRGRSRSNSYRGRNSSFNRGRSNSYGRKNYNNYNRGRSRSESQKRVKFDVNKGQKGQSRRKDYFECWECGKRGHYARNCYSKRNRSTQWTKQTK